MKKLCGLILIAIGLAAAPFLLQSCSNDDGYSIGDFAVDWATVRTTGDTFTLEGDTWGSCWLINLNYGHYQPVDGQRAFITFNPIYDNFQGYDHAIKLESIQDALTKPVEVLTEENSDDYGNDPIQIAKGNIGISGGYVNLVFNQNLPIDPSVKQRISLVADSTAFSDDDDVAATPDGYLHLQLRYNTEGDTSGFYVPALVSFNLRELNLTAASKGIKIQIESEVNGKKELVFESNDKTTENTKGIARLDCSKMQLK
jgi:hypothetical protein